MNIGLSATSAKYLLYKNSYQSGPFAFEEIQKMLESGLITADDLIWSEGMKEWDRCGTVLEQVIEKTEMLNNLEGIRQVPPKIHYIIRHWRGDLSLGISYWFNTAFLTVIIQILASTVITQIATTSLSVTYSALFNLIWMLFIVALFVWQLVGLWRSANKHVSRGGVGSWAILAKTAVIIWVLSGASVCINNIIPAGAENIRILAGDIGLPPYNIYVLPGGSEIEFRGGIRAGSAKALKKMLASVPLAKVLHIESPGGRIYEAVEMAKLIRDRSMSTYTSSECQSAATIILLSGKERVVTTDAKVGFHSASFPGLRAQDMKGMESDMRTIMSNGGVSKEFIDRVLATPSDDMWYPSFKEMSDAGITTSKTNGERFASSHGLISDKEVDVIMKECSKMAGFRILKETHPQEYDKAIQDVFAALRSGKSEGDAYAIFTQYSKKIFDECMPSASDEAILYFRDTIILFFKQNSIKNTEGCIAYLLGAKINYARAFRGNEIEPMLIAHENIIRSGYNNSRVLVNTEEAIKDFEGIIEYLTQIYGEDVLLLTNKSQWKSNPEKVCNMLVSIYEKTQSLPVGHQANIMRFMLSKD